MGLYWRDEPDGGVLACIACVSSWLIESNSLFYFDKRRRGWRMVLVSGLTRFGFYLEEGTGSFLACGFGVGLRDMEMDIFFISSFQYIFWRLAFSAVQ